MNTTVELVFKLKGSVIPADHGYQLFSALTKTMGEIHNKSEIALHNINGDPIDNRLLKLTEKSRLAFRLNSESIEQLLPLTGRCLTLGDHEIQIGTPQTFNLKTVSRLYSRLVVIKGYMEPDEFLEAAGRQIDALGVKGKRALIPVNETSKNAGGRGTRSPFLRRTIRISGKEVVGFALGVGDLTAEESLIIQEKGIGGRRHFGCGIFIPDRR